MNSCYRAKQRFSFSVPLLAFFTLTVFGGQQVTAHAEEKCTPRHEKAMAIFIEPTEEEIEAMKKEDPDNFYTIADDAIYYQWQAVEFLKKRDIPYCFTEHESHEFITGDDRRYSMDRECKYWCLILWNGKDEPVSASAVDMFMYESYLKSAD